MTINKKTICWRLLFAGVFIFVLIILNNPGDNYQVYSGGEDMYRNRRITATQAKELMARYPNAIILDVRTEREFALGHIPGAILLPDFDIGYSASSVLPDLNALILVYCQSGNRSRGATSQLISMGYKNVYDFGGINVWPYGTSR